MKQIKLNLIIFFFTILVSYIILIIYTYLDFNNQFEKKFKNLNNLEIHKKYSNIINHIRDEESLDGYFKNTDSKDLIFNTLSEKKNNNLNLKILIQGNSWIEQINQKGNNFYSYTLFQEFEKKLKVSFINGGTSSYSPSLMNIQLKLLEEDFGIKPDIVVTFINQINVGDEICRYKKNKIYSDGKLQKIKQETFFKGTGWYNYSEKYELSRIYYNEKNNLYKTIELINYKFLSRINRIISQFSYKLKDLIKVNKISQNKCYWEEMEKYLIYPNIEDIYYFKKNIEEYFENVFKNQNIKKLIIITFPLKGHLIKNSNYGFNVSNLIDSIIENNVDFKNITHLNFEKKIKSNASLFDNNNAWLIDQIHLNAYYHAELFTKEILNELNKYLTSIKKN